MYAPSRTEHVLNPAHVASFELHQEVFADASSDESIIIELLELKPELADAESAGWFLRNLFLEQDALMQESVRDIHPVLHPVIHPMFHPVFHRMLHPMFHPMFHSVFYPFFCQCSILCSILFSALCSILFSALCSILCSIVCSMVCYTVCSIVCTNRNCCKGDVMARVQSRTHP